MDTEHDFTMLIVLTTTVVLLAVCYLCILTGEALLSNGYFKRCGRYGNTSFKHKNKGEYGMKSLGASQLNDSTIPMISVINNDDSVTSRSKARTSAGYVEIENSVYEPFVPRPPPPRESTIITHRQLVECQVHCDANRCLLNDSACSDAFGQSCVQSEVGPFARKGSHCINDAFSDTTMDPMIRGTLNFNKSERSNTSRLCANQLDVEPTNSHHGITSVHPGTAKISRVPSGLDYLTKAKLLLSTAYSDGRHCNSSSNSDTTRASGVPSDLDALSRASLLGTTSAYSDTTRASGIPSDMETLSTQSFLGNVSTPSQSARASGVQDNTGHGDIRISGTGRRSGDPLDRIRDNLLEDTSPHSRGLSGQSVAMRDQAGLGHIGNIFSVSSEDWFDSEWENNPCYDSIGNYMK